MACSCIHAESPRCSCKLTASAVAVLQRRAEELKGPQAPAGPKHHAMGGKDGGGAGGRNQPLDELPVRKSETLSCNQPAPARPLWQGLRTGERVASRSCENGWCHGMCVCAR